MISGNHRRELRASFLSDLKLRRGLKASEQGEASSTRNSNGNFKANKFHVDNDSREDERISRGSKLVVEKCRFLRRKNIILSVCDI